jgi:hypothetical protein
MPKSANANSSTWNWIIDIDGPAGRVTHKAWIPYKTNGNKDEPNIVFTNRNNNVGEINVSTGQLLHQSNVFK